MLESIVDYIVLIAAVCVALTNIYKFFKKPVNVAKDHADDMLKKHDEELANAITASIMAKVEPLIGEVKQINLDQNNHIQLLTEGELDLLRQQILYMYQDHQIEQTLTIYQKQQLDKLYNDYIAQGGNSFVQDIYNKMDKWNITP